MDVQLPLDHEQIKSLIPHRYPFLLVDRVTEMEDGTLIRGYKNVSGNEEFFNGHFPGRAIMPGVLILEALAQLGAILGFASSGNRYEDGFLYLFAGIDNVRFKRSVVPGDQLQLEVRIVGGKRGIHKMACRAMVGDHIACSADIMCAERQVSK
ncbi:3-hydroxyacyl-ACP dehydratase FabZ [Natronospirillum operosum]|uniref:3-hydroxyacyl-[acyl-carrier-protein] dehydratase FabZ n=1 Tax=Natronospirillum operosum TaxID=2759953 RepID=A0A4Z0WDQ0_9GAMM|nr:3-hydroxyacyl-ACP dehydratase FabZ [Natronospirillum operosum]TGG95130.1 3-hydroxyacyl-ACP dehydratase FabZ [Natronospirillum operosum]